MKVQQAPVLQIEFSTLKVCFIIVLVDQKAKY